VCEWSESVLSSEEGFFAEKVMVTEAALKWREALRSEAVLMLRVLR
jgi:hypothetical protein